MASCSQKSPSDNPGLHITPDEATKGCTLAQEVGFYRYEFSLYFLGYEDTSSAPINPTERTAWTFGRKITIELTCNWGTESDPDLKGYHNGNSDPRGFGLQITRKNEGYSFHQGFDGYLIEIFDTKTIGDITYAAA